MASRTLAQQAIADGQVTVNGALATKAATMVLPGDAIELLGPPARFVGRGGEKLEGALAAFPVDVAGRRCVDVGSSTGGFTDCLLQHGAASVVAIDVGRAQLHEKLRADDRVEVLEQTDVRSVDPEDIGAPFDLVVIDVSFIGLDRILDEIVVLAGPNGQVLALVKPQFEAGRQEASKGKGVISDPQIWERVLRQAVADARGRGLRVGGVDVSPITGGAGNVEFFLWLGGTATDVPDMADSVTDDAIATVVESAVERSRP